MDYNIQKIEEHNNKLRKGETVKIEDVIFSDFIFTSDILSTKKTDGVYCTYSIIFLKSPICVEVSCRHDFVFVLDYYCGQNMVKRFFHFEINNLIENFVLALNYAEKLFYNLYEYEKIDYEMRQKGCMNFKKKDTV